MKSKIICFFILMSILCSCFTGIEVAAEPLGAPTGAVEGCLKFESATEFILGSTFNDTEYPAEKDGELYISYDNNTWTVWDGTNSSPAKVIYLCGSGNTYVHNIWGDKESKYRFQVFKLTHTAKGDTSGVYCTGSVMSLLDYTNPYETDLTGKPKTFEYLFHKLTLLKSAPELPATKLSANCYRGMFKSTGLESAPQLPATELASACYEAMFTKCTSLVTGPELPATKLYQACYTRMFWGCSSLEEIPMMHYTAEIPKNACVQMLADCPKLLIYEEKPANTIATEWCIPEGTALGNNAVTDMFSGTGGTFTGTPVVGTTYYLVFVKYLDLEEDTSIPSSMDAVSMYYTKQSGDTTYVDTVRVKLEWEVTDLDISYKETKTWNTETLQWDSVKELNETVTGTATFTLTNYGSKAVAASVSFAAASDTTAKLIGASDVASSNAAVTYTEADSVTLGTPVEHNASTDYTAEELYTALAKTVTATVSVDNTSFNAAGLWDGNSTLGTYTVAISEP